MAVFIVPLVLAWAAIVADGALSLALWILAAAGMAGAIWLRTPPGRAAYGRRMARARDAARPEVSDKQRRTKPKPPKLLPLGRANQDQAIPQPSKANLKPRNRTGDR